MSYTEPPVPPVDPSQGEPEPEGRDGSSVLIAVVAVVVVLAMVAAGLLVYRSLSDSRDDASAGVPRATSTPDASGTEPDLSRFYSQQLRWRSCGRAECTTMKVPLDYEQPDGKELTIAVLRVPAQKKSERVGSLVVNPGGPGGSGVEYAAAGSLQFGGYLSDHFDIVGFDPRGVGQSDPLHCLTTEGLDRIIGADPAPSTPEGMAEMDDMLRGFGQGCLDRSGDLAKHMSTVEAAKDMDILRAALGEKKMDYLGASYGTFLGATYADLFPQRVGRFVLDGAVDPSLSNEEMSLAQARGFETALRAYLQDCVDQGGCFLGDTVDAAAQRIRAFLEERVGDPLPTGSDRELTAGWAMIGIWLPLYVKSFWPQLTAALKQAMNDRRGSGLLSLADLYASRGPDGYQDNSMEALYAVNCLDHSDAIPTDQVPSHFAQFEEASPTFGRAFAFSLSTCHNWPVQSGNVTKALHAPGAAPIVVIGTTRDPATPVEWARALADQLESGRLIIRDGDGHTGFQQGNRCVDSAVEGYLVKGDVPQDDLKC